jgi:hypothetical protein
MKKMKKMKKPGVGVGFVFPLFDPQKANIDQAFILFYFLVGIFAARTCRAVRFVPI